MQQQMEPTNKVGGGAKWEDRGDARDNWQLWHCVVVLDIFIWPWWPQRHATPGRAFSCIYLLLLTGALTLIDANWRPDPAFWSWSKNEEETFRPRHGKEKRTRREQLPRANDASGLKNSRPRPRIWPCPVGQLSSWPVGSAWSWRT
ncbi:hypothetical protein ACLKA6_015967 [Drosophila palustris]